MRIQDFKLGDYHQTYRVLDVDLADKYANKLVCRVVKIAEVATKRAHSLGFIPYKGTKGFYIPRATIDWNLPN